MDSSTVSQFWLPNGRLQFTSGDQKVVSESLSRLELPLKHGSEFGLQSARRRWIRRQYHSSGSPMGVCSSLRGSRKSSQNRAPAQSCPLKHGSEFGLQSARRRWIRRQYNTSGSPMGVCSSLRETRNSRQTRALARGCPPKVDAESAQQVSCTR